LSAENTLEIASLRRKGKGKSPCYTRTALLMVHLPVGEQIANPSHQGVVRPSSDCAWLAI